MNKGSLTIRTIDLDRDQMLILDSGCRGHVRVLYGAVWLTAEGLPDDTVLPAGAADRLPVQRTRITGLTPTRVQITEPRLGPIARLREFWTRLRRGLMQRIARLQFGPLPAQTRI